MASRKSCLYGAAAALAVCSLIAVTDVRAAPGDLYQGTPVGFTADGHPYRGNPNAPLTLIEYTDYVCPFCESYFRQTLPALLDKYGRSGKVKFVVQDLPLASLHPTAPKGAVAAQCVSEQSAGRFWRMHDDLFERQQQWGRLPDPGAFLTEAATKAGAEPKAYARCIASGKADARVKQSVAAAQALGFAGTPSFQLVSAANGKTYTLIGAQPTEVFAAWIDALLAGKEPPKPPEAEKPELPAWAKAEGLVPDPLRPGYTTAGDPYKGNPNARLVVVEFGDFQCASCQRHALSAQPVLDKQFVDTGEVMWVVKQFPLRIHPNAPAAAVAAQCAGEQGKFWPMHHLLFETIEQWSTGDDPDPALKRLARTLSVDSAKFDACLMSRKTLERVMRDMYDGQGINVRNVPAFIMLQGGTGVSLVGARSTEEFASTLRKQLERAKSDVATAR